MAKVVITIEDTEGNTNLTVSANFEPRVESLQPEGLTPAHFLSSELFEMVKKLAGAGSYKINHGKTE